MRTAVLLLLMLAACRDAVPQSQPPGDALEAAAREANLVREGDDAGADAGSTGQGR